MTENNTLQNENYKQTECGKLPPEQEVVKYGNWTENLRVNFKLMYEAGIYLKSTVKYNRNLSLK